MSEKYKEHQHSSKVESYLINLFKEKEIPYSEGDIGFAAENLVKFFKLLHITAVEVQGKPKQIKQESIRAGKKVEYAPRYIDQYRIRPMLSEFMNMMTKEQIIEICFTIKDFNKHKEQTNIEYKKIHEGMTKEYKQFLLFQQAQKPKPELILSTISTSTIFDEKMTLENQILSEFIDSPEYDEYGLPYYP